MNYQTITVENMDGTTTDHIIIDHGNDQYTSFPAVEGNPAYEAFLKAQHGEADQTGQ